MMTAVLARLRNRRGGLLIFALGGAVLLGITTPPGAPPVLIWLSFAPLALLARELEPSEFKRAFWLGATVGLGIGFLGFPWIALTLQRFAKLPAIVSYFGLAAFSAWTAIPYGLWLVGVVLGPRRGALALAWPVALWVSLSAAWPSLFPYTPVLGFAQTPQWIQAAELGGVGLVESLVVACGVLVADAAMDPDKRVGGRRLLAALALPILTWSLGSWRMAVLDREVEHAQHVRFGIVQPNTPLFLPNRKEKVLRLRRESQALEREGAQIILWPEAGVYPYVIPRPYLRDQPGFGQVMKYHHVPTLFGLGTRDPSQPYNYNSAAALDAAGNVIGVFDKNNLVPFGEFIPIIDPAWVRGFVPAVSHNLAGEAPARFTMQPAATPDRPDPGGPIHVGPLICYEDILPAFGREVAQQPGGVEVFANLTIDTWFGDTKEPWEHLALAQFRTVEHRIPMVRSVAAGTSSVVDHNGRLVAALEVTDPTIDELPPAQHLLHDVALVRNTVERPTVYARMGWLYTWLCHLAVVWAVGVALRQRWARRRGAS